MKIILHESNGNLVVTTPAKKILDAGIDVLEIALKDVPSGDAFWIVEQEDFLKAIESLGMAEGLELDKDALGEPTGYGRDSSELSEEALLILKDKK